MWNVNQSDFWSRSLIALEKTYSNVEKRVVSRCVGDSNLSALYSGDAFHQILRPRIITMGSRDLQAKLQTYALAYAP